ncbi:MAG: pyridoxamine 5'-phosphate oxidase family protein, partial [Candidatus Thorarchaeota archaeon]
TKYGKKISILSKNSNVCVSIEHFEQDLSNYYFISIQGKLKLVEDIAIKQKVINLMMKKAQNKFSSSFLSAHGFEKSKGWKSFTIKDQLIYKLEEIKTPIGLKSI